MIYFPDPSLKTKCEDISIIEDPVNEIIQQMLHEMSNHGGIGISGPQVGYLKNIIIADDRLFINPTIISKTGRITTQEEGCLSIPDILISVARHDIIKVRYQMLDGWKEDTFDGLMSRVIQHECDHLNGILIIDK